MHSAARCRTAPAHVLSTVALAAGLMGAVPARAADESSALQDFLVRDSQLLLQLRTYYFDRHNPGDVVNAAWAAGGWLDYRTGWLGGMLQLGVVGYTSLPVWAPDDTGGTSLLGPQQQSLSVIGQVYASLKIADQVLTGGRFEVRQPEVNPNDIRMIPNTFQGGKLMGKVAGVNYFAGYINAMKIIASTNFVNMATVAGAPADVSSPLWTIGLDGTPMEGSHWRFSSYYVPDVLTSTYADGYWTTQLSPAYSLRLGAQAMYQSSNGSDALTGSAFSTGTGGLRADLSAGGATATFAYNQTARGAAYSSPYGGWAGYTFMIVKSFNQAGEKAYLIGGTYDFAKQGLPGLALNANIVFGRDSINASTGAPLPNNTEYDLTLDYRFTSERWPAWARPLWIRARAAYVDQGSAGDTNDYRIIVNYPWVL